MPPHFEEKPRSTVARILIRFGVAQSEKQAEMILVAVAAFCMLVVVWTMLPEKRPSQNNVQQNPNYEPVR